MCTYGRSVLTRPSSAHPSNRWIDIVGGVVLPILCVVLDPIVFKTSTILPGIGAPLLQGYVVFAYAEMLLCMSAFIYWLWSPQAASPFLAGLLGSGVLFSLGLGLFQQRCANPQKSRCSFKNNGIQHDAEDRQDNAADDIDPSVTGVRTGWAR